MRRVAFMSVVWAVVFCTGVGAAATAERATTRPSNTREASCLLKIACDPEVVPLDLETIDAMLNSSGVKDKAIKKILQRFPTDGPLHEVVERVEVTFEALGPGAQPSAVGRTAARGPMPLSPTPLIRSRGSRGGMAEVGISLGQSNVILGRLAVTLDDEIPPVAAELMNLVTSELDSVLRRAFEDYRNRLHAVTRDVIEEERTCNERDLRHLQRVEQELLKQAGQSDLSREHVLDRIRDLEKEQRELESRLWVQKARREALEKHIAAIRDKVSEQVKDDPIVKELQQIIVIREKLVSEAKPETRSKEDPKLVPAESYLEVREGLVRARLQLAERQAAIHREAGAVGLPELTKQLTDLSIETAEAEAALQFAKKQLGEIRAKDLLELANEYETEIALRRPLVREAFESATRRRDELSRQLKMARPPEVMVIGR